jgi:two-component system chemotaxis response regulator CheY
MFFWVEEMDKNKPQRVLVVDDDMLIREVLKAILRSEGFKVVGEARDGEAGIAQTDALRPDVVCLDINMPGMSGLDALKVLREKFPQVRVVMITGEASTGTVRDAVSSGASGYIIKPFNAKRVSAVLRTAFKLPGDSPFS